MASPINRRQEESLLFIGLATPVSRGLVFKSNEREIVLISMALLGRKCLEFQVRHGYSNRMNNADKWIQSERV